MTSTPTTRNRLNKQATGSNPYTWGSVLNGQVFDLIDESLDGIETIDLTADRTLTATNYVSDEARNRGLKFTDTGGVLTGDVTVTLPSNEKIYWIINDTAQSVILDAGGTTGTVEAGRRKWVSVDSSNNVDVGEDGADKEYVDTQLASKASLSGGNTFAGVQNHGGLLKYTADLSGDYDDRSLVDKAYVNGVAMGSISISFDWADITGKPTTIAGFGITDAYTKTESDGRFFQDTIKTQWRLRP